MTAFLVKRTTLRVRKFPASLLACHLLPLSCIPLLLDGGGGRNLANRRENGVHHIAERSHTPSTQPVLQKTKTNTTSQATR